MSILNISGIEDDAFGDFQGGKQGIRAMFASAILRAAGGRTDPEADKANGLGDGLPTLAQIKEDSNVVTSAVIRRVALSLSLDRAAILDWPIICFMQKPENVDKVFEHMISKRLGIVATCPSVTSTAQSQKFSKNDTVRNYLAAKIVLELDLGPIETKAALVPVSPVSSNSFEPK